MQVTELAVFQVDIPVKDGSYDWSGNSYSAFDSTIVRLRTDEGLTGYGEVTPLGSTYLPAHPRGARAGIEELAQGVLGADPIQPAVIMDQLDSNLRGHPHAKSAIDMACWDITGKRVNAPLTVLLGGRFGDGVPSYGIITKGTPEEMAASAATYRDEGYKLFQAKVGESPMIDAERIRAVRAELDSEHIFAADANTGLTRHEAIRLVNAVEDIDVYIEQPCETYEDCRAVRQRSDHPFILDEPIDGLQPIIRGYREDTMDIVKVKISSLGGLTRARVVRDFCTELGINVFVEDTWGSEILTSAIIHLVHSVPTDARIATLDFHNYNTITTADGAPTVENGRMAAPTDPGLGIEPRTDVLGDPIAVYN